MAKTNKEETKVLDVKDITPDEFITSVINHMTKKFGKIEEYQKGFINVLYSAYQNYYAAKKSLQNDGIMLISKNGSFYANPALSIENQSMSKLFVAMRRLGLEPKSELELSRLQIKEYREQKLKDRIDANDTDNVDKDFLDEFGNN